MTAALVKDDMTTTRDEDQRCGCRCLFDVELFYTSSKSTLLIAIIELQEVECESHHPSIVFMHSFVRKFDLIRQPVYHFRYHII